MFIYLRIFLIVSLVIVVAASGLAGVSFRTLALDDLTHLIERSNSSLAQGYVNAVWNKHRKVIVPIADDPAQLRSNPQVTEFAQDTVRYFQQMPLIRVNIYSAKGLLLMTANVNTAETFKNNAASPDAGFVASQMQRASVDSRLLQDVSLQHTEHAAFIQTVVPIHGEGGAGLEGSVEILYDITEPSGRLLYFQLYGTGGIIAAFLIFVCTLFLTARKAEIIISRQHEANLELAAAATAAQAENQDKSQFLANISHELRTPLNAIIGFSDILKNNVPAGPENQTNQNFINDIHSSGVHLLSLINDILDYSKAEAGKLELEISEISASKTVQNCLRLVSPRAETAQVKLVEALPKDQIIMTTDGKKFKQVCLNLLSNAVKFTPPGGQVSVGGWHNLNDDTFTFEVRDSGIGIGPKDISRAMSPFGQVDNTLKRKYEGTGLGLPLTKKFVELMGGKFTIESKMNVGTTITFTLPRVLAPREGMMVKPAS